MRFKKSRTTIDTVMLWFLCFFKHLAILEIIVYKENILKPSLTVDVDNIAYRFN